MRVLMISDVYFPRVNGVSTSIETFRGQLAHQGVSVSLVAPDYTAEQNSHASMPLNGIWRIASRPVPRDPEDRLISWFAARRCFPKLAAEHFQLIHIQTPFVAHYLGTAFGRYLAHHLHSQAKVPIIATYHTLFEEYLHHYLPFLPAHWLKNLARVISRWQCNALDHVIVPSSAMKARLREYGITTPMTVLPTGIPLQRFEQANRERFRQQYGIAKNQPVALFVGRVAFEKNIDFLLQMLTHLREKQPDILLIITGEGPARASLEKQVHALGLGNHVRFLGYLDRQTELPDAYAGADVFVFASRTETQGLVLLEAMAAGLPVVALAEMGTKDILTPEQGCRIAQDNPALFAETVFKLIHLSPSETEKISAEARAYAHEWSDVRMAERMSALYQNLTHTKQISPA